MASLSEADQLLLKNNPSLTNADIKTYNVKKAKLFKLTISICAIYGTLAIVILLLTLFSSQGSQIFTEEVRPFTLTFVGGMIIVIILLIIQIVSFKPIALSTSTFDKDRCPDFWKLVQTPTNDPVYSNATNDIKQLLAYKCVPDTNILQTYRPAANAAPASAAMVAAVSALSPVIITVRIPIRRSCAKRSRIPPLTTSLRWMTPRTSPPSDTARGVPPARETSWTMRATPSGYSPPSPWTWARTASAAPLRMLRGGRPSPVGRSTPLMRVWAEKCTKLALRACRSILALDGWRVFGTSVR